MCTVHMLHTCKWYFLSFLMHGISCTVCLLLKDTQSCEKLSDTIKHSISGTNYYTICTIVHKHSCALYTRYTPVGGIS